MKNLIISLFLSISLFSCKKDQEDINFEKARKYCKENMEFSCNEIFTNVSFSGEINGEKFCVSDEVDGYWAQIGIGTMHFTPADNPTLEPGTTPVSSFFSFSLNPPIIDNLKGEPEDFTPFVTIQTPHVLDSIVLPNKDYIDLFLKEGDLKIRKGSLDGTGGFLFTIVWGCNLPPAYQFRNKQTWVSKEVAWLSPSFGKQEDFIFKLSEFHVQEDSDYFNYDVSFEISCDLYLDDSYDNEYYGRLENGIYKIQFRFLKEE